MDPNKKYPLMVYFYERNSDGLHNYRPPAPSASTINIPLFVSNEYVVFVPDIKYTIGFPGQSAYDCIVPGVNTVVSMGFVDEKNMAIQGQSWGGYQVAWLITRTNMFKAAGAGAPVVNMTSAYGGIRWGTGMSRMFQYEQTQSRIGGTLWEKPWHYIENSPLFMSDRVETPLLMTHNDADGAVPWYQGIEFYMALRRFNKPVWLLVYNGEDHNLVQRKNRKDLSVRLLQFFDHYLKGAPAPIWMEEGIPATLKGKDLGYDIGERK
jgi:dipeptidyl aminopeptidase/acylaminoacyl peptidase